jgi:hypothetical protein
MNDTIDELIAIVIILLIPTFIFGGLLTLGLTVKTTTEIQYQTLWFAQAPFGSVYGDATGVFVWGSGSISTSPSSAYTVKYWSQDRTQLLSKTVDATNTPIVTDGTLRLETTIIHHWNIYGRRSIEEDTISYILHLPTLPENITQGTFQP